MCISGHWGFSSSPLLDFFFFLKLYCKVDICKHWGPAAHGALTSPVPMPGTASGGFLRSWVLGPRGAAALPRPRLLASLLISSQAWG